jgi:hypothetical protein
MKKLLMALCVLLVYGCATTPIPLSDAKLVPPDRIFRTEKLPIEGNAQVIFVRDTGLQGGLPMYQNLFINGKKAALLDTGEKVEFILPTGDYIFGVSITHCGDCRSGNLFSIDQDLKAGGRYFYRIMTGEVQLFGEGRIDIQRFLPETKE